MIEFDSNGISQLFSAIDENGAPYDYYFQRIDPEVGDVFDGMTAYVPVNAKTAEHGPGLTYGGMLALVTARQQRGSETPRRPYSVENVAPSSADLGNLLSRRDS
jgi:hypothetical protein